MPQVAEDECRHFQLLEKRLEQTGSHYGALPAHDGLWESAWETGQCWAGAGQRVATALIAWAGGPAGLANWAGWQPDRVQGGMHGGADLSRLQ